MTGIPTYEELMGPLLKRIKAHGEVGIIDLVPEFVAEFKLSDEQKEETTPNTNFPILNSRMHFAKWYLMKANLISRVRHGIYELTDAGRSALAGGERIDNNYLMKNCEEFNNWRNSTTENVDKLNEENKEENKKVRDRQPVPVDLDDAEDRFEAEAAILEFLKVLDTELVECIVVELLKAEAKTDSVQHTGGWGDKGIDAIVYSGPLGIFETGVQVKRFKDDEVKYQAIHNFIGALVTRKMSNGIFVTTSEFSADIEDVAANADRSIRLVNGLDFAKLIIKYNVIEYHDGKVEIDDITKIKEDAKSYVR